MYALKQWGQAVQKSYVKNRYTPDTSIVIQDKVWQRNAGEFLTESMTQGKAMQLTSFEKEAEKDEKMNKQVTHAKCQPLLQYVFQCNASLNYSDLLKLLPYPQILTWSSPNRG